MTASIERIEGRLADALDRLDLLEGMIDTTRRVVAAEKFKVETDSSSPQIIEASEAGGLALGSEGALQVLGTVTEQSHTGDTAETELGNITVPANRMKLNGFVRIAASFRGMGAGFHTFKVKFGGAIVRQSIFSGTNVMVDIPATYVWNKGVANAQGSGIASGVHHLRNTEGPHVGTIDTTADVAITFTVQNSVAGDTAFLRFALVETYNGDG